jgi:hypothetical protein
MQGIGSLLSVAIVIACLSIGMSDAFTWRFALAFGAVPVLIAFPFRLKMHETETFQRVTACRQQALTAPSDILTTPIETETGRGGGGGAESGGSGVVNSGYGSFAGVTSSLSTEAVLPPTSTVPLSLAVKSDSFRVANRQPADTSETVSTVVSSTGPSLHKKDRGNFLDVKGNARDSVDRCVTPEPSSSSTSGSVVDYLAIDTNRKRVGRNSSKIHSKDHYSSSSKDGRSKNSNGGSRGESDGEMEMLLVTDSVSGDYLHTDENDLHFDESRGIIVRGKERYDALKVDKSATLLCVSPRRVSTSTATHAPDTTSTTTITGTAAGAAAAAGGATVDATHAKGKASPAGKPISAAASSLSSASGHASNIRPNSNNPASFKQHSHQHHHHRHQHEHEQNQYRCPKQASLEPPSRMSEIASAFKYFKWHMLGTSLCWFLLDVDFYANGLFNHQITSSILSVPGQTNSALVDAWNTGILSLIAIPGYYLSVLYIDTVGRKNLQMFGFLMMGVLFFLCSAWYDWLMEAGGGVERKYLFLVLYALTFLFRYAYLFIKMFWYIQLFYFILFYFILFYFILFYFIVVLSSHLHYDSNFGPNTTSFVIPGEIFPAEVN